MIHGFDEFVALAQTYLTSNFKVLRDQFLISWANKDDEDTEDMFTLADDTVEKTVFGLTRDFYKLTVRGAYVQQETIVGALNINEIYDAGGGLAPLEASALDHVVLSVRNGSVTTSEFTEKLTIYRGGVTMGEGFNQSGDSILGFVLRPNYEIKFDFYYEYIDEDAIDALFADNGVLGFGLDYLVASYTPSDHLWVRGPEVTSTTATATGGGTGVWSL